MDLIISGGRLIDGSGAPWRYADLGVSEGRLVAVGRLQDVEAVHHLDARGRIVCPGFIDMHSHADLSLLTGKDMDLRLRQGITTEVVGQDGLSYAPASADHLQQWRRYLAGMNGDAPDELWTWRTVGEFIHAIDRGMANAVYLVPHGAVRVEAMGWEARAADDRELARMRVLVREALAQGAAGLSTGLTYAPSAHGTTEELVALCEEVARAGGVYVTHLRSYGASLSSAIQEAVDIGCRSGVAVHLSHLRITERARQGQSEQVLEAIERARDSGVDITFDIYPYTVGCGPLFVLLPVWAQSGGPDQLLSRLSTPQQLKSIIAEMSSWTVDWSTYTLSNAPPVECGHWDGVRLDEAARQVGLSVEEFIPRLLLESELNAAVLADGGSEMDNDRMFSHPASMVASDGVLTGDHPHPRAAGCYPRVLAHYVRGERRLSWEQAIHKMTGLPAARLNLQDRGLLRVGAFADLVVLVPDQIADGATYSNGRCPPLGIDLVLVNGQVVVEKGKLHGGGAGMALRPLNW